MASILFAGDFALQFPNSDFFCANGVKKKIQAADLAVCNFEGPIRHESSRTAKKVGPVVLQELDAVRVLKELGFGLVGLANNHIMDLGLDGLRNTISKLKLHKTTKKRLAII